MEAYLSQWQLWLALAVIIGGVKLLDLSLGKYRDWREDKLSERLSVQRQISQINRALFGCNAAVITDRFRPILKRLIALEEHGGTFGVERLRTDFGLAIDAVNQRITALQALETARWTAHNDRIFSLEQAVQVAAKCCAEKPAKAQPAPEAKYRAAPAPKPATTTRRTR